MKNIFKRLVVSYRSRSIFVNSFINNTLFVACLVSIISLFVFRLSESVVDSEFINANNNTAERNANLTDILFKDVNNMISHLYLDINVRTYITHENPEAIINWFDQRMHEKTSMFPLIYNYIDSVYIYSDITKSIYTNGGNTDFHKFSDLNWFDFIESAPEGQHVIPRAKENIYPFLLTFVKKFHISGSMGIIVINIDLGKLGNMVTNNSTYQEMLIVSGDKIIYQSNMDNILVPANQNPYLTHLNSIEEKGQILKSTEPYAISKVASELFDWEYVSVTFLHEYSNKLSSVHGAIVVMIITLLLFGLLIAYLLSVRAYTPLKKLNQILESPEIWTPNQELYSAMEVKQIAQKIIQTVHLNRRLQDELKDNLDILNKTKIFALQTQINPHFLLNTLNVVNLELSQTFGPHHGFNRILSNLSGILRYSLNIKEDMVTVGEEIRYSKLYVEILKARYKGIFTAQWLVDKEIYSMKIPKLCFQPIIENAVFHGMLAKSEGEGEIVVRGWQENGRVVFEIQDNGGEFCESSIKQLLDSFESDVFSDDSHIGLKNVYQRMKMIFGLHFQMNISCEPGQQTIVRLSYVGG